MNRKRPWGLRADWSSAFIPPPCPSLRPGPLSFSLSLARISSYRDSWRSQRRDTSKPRHSAVSTSAGHVRLPCREGCWRLGLAAARRQDTEHSGDWVWFWFGGFPFHPGKHLNPCISFQLISYLSLLFWFLIQQDERSKSYFNFLSFPLNCHLYLFSSDLLSPHSHPFRSWVSPDIPLKLLHFSQ